MNITNSLLLQSKSQEIKNQQTLYNELVHTVPILEQDFSVFAMYILTSPNFW